MIVILNRDVKGTGKAGDVVKVRVIFRIKTVESFV